MQKIFKRPGDYILIGHQGEHKARQICIDISSWMDIYGSEGDVELIYQRPGDSAPYPVTVEREGSTVLWTITNTDTEKAGAGRAELRYSIGDTLVKSATSITNVSPALDVPSAVPESPGLSWLDQALGIAKMSGGTVKQNNLTNVAEMVGVARSYHKVRWQDEAKTVPTFIYNQDKTVLTGAYNPNSSEFKGAIDCSTYIGLVLRGIPFEKSPYAHLATAKDSDTEDEFDGSDDNVSGDTDDNISTDEAFDPANLLANTKDYGWAINPFDWSNKLVNNEYPVRTASQLAQWMCERGQMVPLDETFSNLMPGDIIFWAKKKSNGDWVQPNRYQHISHVAMCANVMDAPTPEEDDKFPSGYPKKHTMLEVTTSKPYVLNRTLEKCSPDSVAMICRPDLGSLSSGDFKGNLSTNFGVTDISTWYRPGLYYLTSDVVGGLPDGVESGKYCTLRVEVSRTRQGSVRTITHTLINAKTNVATYINTQYCYNRLPGKDNWTGWRSEGSSSGSNSSQNVDLTGYATKQYVQNYAQPKGEYLTEETDPTVPSWAKQPNKPSYTAAEVGARPNTWMPTAKEVGALPSSYVPPDQTPEQVGADPAGTAEHTVDVHNTSTTSHNDIRLLIEGLSNDKLDADKLPTAINTALAQAEESGEFKGDPGKDGKSAYQYAQDGGYVGAEEEFADMMAGNILEPADGDIPKVFLTGDEFSKMTKEKNEVSMEMDYVSKTDAFHAFILIKWQGSTSLNFAKKNFTVKLFDDEAHATKQKHLFRDWKYAKNKFVLKANWIDHTHARNIVCANIWNEVVASRNDYDTLPEELRNSPKNGAIDGFPVKLYVNGTYQGVYTWNIGKDDWQWGMDEDNTDHALLCVTHNTNGVFKDRAYNFRALWSGVDEEAFEIEVGTNSDALKNGVNAMLSCIINNNGAAFRNSIGQYLDVKSAIDYYIHQYIICGLDGLAKNILIGSYDLSKWYMGAYDMDAVLGLWYDGTNFVSTDYKCPEDYQEKFNLLFERLEENFWPEIQARYAELRKSVFSFANMCFHFERFTDKIGTELFAEDLEMYPGIPQGSTNNIKQLRNYIRDRLAYCDEQILNGIPGTGVTLNKSILTVEDNATAPLSATVTPSDTTDDVYWWSDNTAVATVDGGVITSVAEGNCTIYAKCGSGYASCAVTVATSVEPEPAYTNRVPLSIDTDGSIYNGTGYKNGYRMSSGGAEKAQTSCVATGYIPAKSGDTIRIAGYKWYDTGSSSNYLNAYKSDFSFLYAGNAQGGYGTGSLIESMNHDDATGISTVKLKNVADVAYIRISLWNDTVPNGAHLIVTVNEEIT